MTTTMDLPDLVTLPVDQITPYWRNPRRIPDDAVEAVRTSIERYGYQQPIVVDSEHVVIVGHTRLAAVKALGWTEVPVYVSRLPEEKAKEYRLVDNRTGEMSEWDHSALVVELREFETGLLETFFPDVDLEVGQIDGALHEGSMADAEAKINRVTEAAATATATTEVVCPSCYHTFHVRTRSLPGISHGDLETLAEKQSTEAAAASA